MKAKPNGELKIESGIPIPPRGKQESDTKLLRQMNVGDSVLFTKTRQHVSTMAQVALGSGNYTVRKVEGGTRVWRTK